MVEFCFCQVKRFISPLQKHKYKEKKNHFPFQFYLSAKKSCCISPHRVLVALVLEFRGGMGIQASS